MADRTVTYRFRGDIADLQSKMVAAGKSVGTLADNMTKADARSAKFRQGLSSVGDTAGKVGLGAAAGLAAVVKVASDWESAWAGVTKTVDGSASQMAALEGELRELARTLPASHTEIAAVAEAAGQLGVQREAVASFTETMIALGETTNLTADEAATSIARFANIMGTSQTEVDRIGSALVDLGNSSATTEAEILQLGQRLAAAGSIAGLTEGDVLGFAAALTSVGVEAEAGGTALSKVFTSMRDAAIDGGEKLQVFAETAGMTAQQFTAAWSADPAKTIDAFVQGLGRINESGQSTSAVFKELGLTDQRLMRALLSAAEAGELLGESIDMGNVGFEENTALAIEAAKRYETTASQAQVALNNMKDAAIDFGEVALPAVAGVAEKISGTAQAIGSLPGPVKSASTAMLGITAVLGGGLWFTAKTVTGIANMRQAFSDLGPAGSKAAGALGKVGRAASAVGIAFAGLAIADSISKLGDEAVPALEGLTRRLIDLASAAPGISLSLGAEFDSLSESIQRLADPSLAQSLNDNLSDALGGIGAGRSLREARAQVEGLDAALANLVATGNADVAAKALENLAVAQNLTDRETEQLLSVMPQYAEALAAVENDATLAANASSEAGGAFGDMGDDAAGAAADITELVDAMREQRSEAIRAANAQINYQAALDDARASIKENGKALDITTEKGRANRRALLDVAAAWNEQSAAAKNAPGAQRAAIKSFVDLATQMGMGEDQARRLAQRILEIPDKKVKVEADTSQAEGAIRGVTQSLLQLDGRTARTYVTTVYSAEGRTNLGGLQERASGGYISGPGGPRDDLIPARLSNGEYVIQAAAVAKYGRSMFDRLNSMRFADGGYVGMASGGSIDDRLELLRLQQQINELRRDLAATGEDQIKGLARAIAEAELEAAKRDLRQARLAPLRETRSSLRDQMQALRGIGLDVEGGASLEETREALREFRQAVRESGGEWTKQMARMSHNLIDAAKAAERTQGRLEVEAEKRDELAAKLDDEIAALERVRDAMDSFASSVAGNFASDIFGGFGRDGGGSSGGGGGGTVSQSTSRRVELQAQLAAVQANAALDPLERSHLASKLRAELDALGEVADAAGGMTSAAAPAVDGLEALRQTLVDDTARALEFASALQQLEGALDADFFRELAASGNLAAAQELAGMDRGELAEVDALWQQREQALAELGAYAANAVFGEELDAATKAVQATEKSLAAMDATIERLNTRLENLGNRVERGAERGVASLGQQIAGIRAEIRSISTEAKQGRRSGSGKGRS